VLGGARIDSIIRCVIPKIKFHRFIATLKGSNRPRTDGFKKQAEAP
jgi:hypothetical protein